ncbi:MAG: molybdopterin oxidoreductase [Pseudoflavonifractor sp.]
MKDRDYLWCAMNLLLDDEEALAALCPDCRAEAERGVCPACGRGLAEAEGMENAAFDPERYGRLARGEQA